jgi:hypothetical protein
MAHIVMEARLEADTTEVASGFAFMPAATPVEFQGAGVSTGRVNVRNRPPVRPLSSAMATGIASFATPLAIDPRGSAASTGRVQLQSAPSSTPLSSGASSGRVLFGPLNLSPVGVGSAAPIVNVRAGNVVIAGGSVGVSSSILTFARIELLTARSTGVSSGRADSIALIVLRIDPLGSGASRGRVLMDGYAVDPEATAQRAVLAISTDQWQLQRADDGFTIQIAERFELVRATS